MATPRHTWAVALVAACFATTAAAQGTGTATQSPAAKSSEAAKGTSTLSSNDREFITKAATGGMTEVQLGEIARKNAASDAVKQFASRMVQDHGKAK